MLYTVYRTTNLLNGKTYIGKHQTLDADDSYLGSGVFIQRAIRKYGRANFRKDILFVLASEEEMNLKEAELVTEEFVSRDDTYNIGVGGQGGAHFKGKRHSDETKEKIRNILDDPLMKSKLSKGKLGKTLSDETKAKLSIVMRGKNSGKTLSEEHKRKISNTLVCRS